MNLLIVTTLASAVLAGVSGFGIAWKLQGANITELKEDYAQQLLVNERANAATAIRRVDQVMAAQNAANVRADSLRADANSSRAALIGLSNATERALSNAAASHNACLVTATANSELLNLCSSRYRELGETSDRHVSDLKTLTESWPTGD